MAPTDGLDTKGRRALLGWIAEDPAVRTQTSIADRLGCKQSSVSDWVTGKARPTGILLTILCALLGCVEDDWRTAEERKALRAGLRRAGLSAA